VANFAVCAVICYTWRDFRLPPRSSWELPSYCLLRRE